VEALQEFRPTSHLAGQLDELGPADAIAPGTLSQSWLGPRSIASAILTGSFADVQRHDWIAYLHKQLLSQLAGWGVGELDGAVLRSTATRAITQAASRLVYEASLADGSGAPAFAGVAYESRFGSDIACWAVFEYADLTKAPFTQVSLDQLQPDDPDLIDACAILGIRYP